MRRHYRVSWNCCFSTSVNGCSPTEMRRSKYSSKTTLSMNTHCSTSNTPLMRSNGNKISFTLGMAEPVYWYTHERSLWMSPGHMLMSYPSTTLLFAPPQIPNQNDSRFGGFGGWNVSLRALLGQIHVIMHGSCSFHGPTVLEAHLTLLIHHTLSIAVILFPPLTSAKHASSSIHPLHKTQRGIGVLTM